MKIENFKASKINGYLDFDLKFDEKLSFVTGINGTGKTSALNSIVALLLPRLDYLADHEYEFIELTIHHEDRRVVLRAEKSADTTSITCSLFPEDEFEFNEFETLDSASSHRNREYEEEYYKDILLRHSDNPVIGFLDDLPTPMFLGLDRRSVSMDYGRATIARPPQRRRRRKAGVFGRSLGQSLDEALFFAQQNFQSTRRKEARLDAKFRELLVLSLISFEPISFLGRLENPTPEELQRIEEARTNLRKLPELLNVSAAQISSSVDPMFNFLDEKLSIIKKPGKRKKPEEETEERLNALIEWEFNKTQLSKINDLSKIVSDYNTEYERIFEHSNSFLNSVNSFLQDSGKTLKFDSIGELNFDLQDDRTERDIRTLSSGEIQLIVILTHLYFNPEVETANVFIIDEPELSLHVQWQEKFVDSITDASDKTQFILATHSPAIILDKVDHCIEISAAQ